MRPARRPEPLNLAVHPEFCAPHHQAHVQASTRRDEPCAVAGGCYSRWRRTRHVSAE